MDAQRRAESIRDQLLAEWSDLYVDIEDGEAPTLKVYGARKLYSQQLARAEAVIGNHYDIELQNVEAVYCSKSKPVKMGREVGQAAGSAARFIAEDQRGVALMCNNEDGHTAHDWGTYEPLPK